nr:hypothetical protein [Enterococcus faecium]
MKRKWELLLGMVGGSLSLIFFGGLAVTLSNIICQIKLDKSSFVT